MTSIPVTAVTADYLRSILSERILLLDGAMGSMIFGLGLEEKEVRGERFADHHKELKKLYGCLQSYKAR